MQNNIKPMKYTALIVETEEILECSNFQVLYKAARRHARYYASHEGTKTITVKFYKDLTDYSFSRVPAFYIMGWTE